MIETHGFHVVVLDRIEFREKHVVRIEKKSSSLSFVPATIAHTYFKRCISSASAKIAVAGLTTHQRDNDIRMLWPH